MDKFEYEERIAALESQMAALKRTVQKISEQDSVRMLKTELKVEAIQDQLKEYDLVQTAAYGGYFATHPEVRRDLSYLQEIIGVWPPEPPKPDVQS
jgi:uncharacterized coiled-coil protein SlyX